MMKITALIVEDEHGHRHKFEGEGFVMTTSEQEKQPGGAMAKIIGLSVEAKLVVPKDGP